MVSPFFDDEGSRPKASSDAACQLCGQVAGRSVAEAPARDTRAG
jgi:hypothetical protein